MITSSDTVQRTVMEQRKEAVKTQERLAQEKQRFAVSCRIAAEAIAQARSETEDAQARKILLETARKLMNEARYAEESAQNHAERAKLIESHQTEASKSQKPDDE